jgi:hypothetical protein
LSLRSTWEARTECLLTPIEPSAVEGVLIVSFNIEALAGELEPGDVALAEAASGGRSLAFGFRDGDEDRVKLGRLKLRLNRFLNEIVSLT